MSDLKSFSINDFASRRKSSKDLSLLCFVTSAREVLTEKYGCRVEIIGDPDGTRGAMLSPEYASQAMTVFAAVARGKDRSKVIFETTRDRFTVSIEMPASIDPLGNSFIAESTADILGFTFTTSVEGDTAYVKLSTKLNFHPSLVLYAISPDEFYEMLAKYLL